MDSTDGSFHVYYNNAWVEVSGGGGGGATSLDDLTDVDTSTTPPTDGQVLTWVTADSKWEPADASGGGGGAVDSVNSQTGVVSLGIQDMDDFELNPGVGPEYNIVADSSVPGAGNASLFISFNQWMFDATDNGSNNGS